MQKKLMAVAIAGALGLPGSVALAQSSVTITGNLKASIANTSLRGRPAGSLGNSSETRVEDESSRIIFKMREDLGGGLAAIGQVDWRVTTDTGTDAAAGNTFVGLTSKSWGTIVLGRRDLHYYNRESHLTVNGSLKADSISILGYAGAGASSIAVTSRTTNVVHYTSPNWGGFTFILAMSTNPFAAEADLGSGTRRGQAWNFNPNYKGKNFQIGYSYWKSKSDAGAAPDQRGDRLYGSINFGGWKVGLAWDKARIRPAAGGADTSRRTAWSIPVHYEWGKHGIYAHYDHAGNDKATAINDSATMFAISYAYKMSKRTSLALTYAQINNNVGGRYNFFTGAGGLGSGSTAVTAALAGSDPRIMSATINHKF